MSRRDPLPRVRVRPQGYLVHLNIRICFEFRASNFEFGSGLFGLG